jgi:hypothetical protein
MTFYIEKVESNPDIKDQDFEIEVPKTVKELPLPKQGWQ